jgi:hypothetical protein
VTRRVQPALRTGWRRPLEPSRVLDLLVLVLLELVLLDRLRAVLRAVLPHLVRPVREREQEPRALAVLGHPPRDRRAAPRQRAWSPDQPLAARPLALERLAPALPGQVLRRRALLRRALLPRPAR